MKPTSLPPFSENTHYRALHPVREGKKIWRFVTLRETFIPIPGIVGAREDREAIIFYSADGVIRGWIENHGITLASGYAWNGCSPKRWIWPFGWTGTPDYPSTILASAYHDMLYQFSRTQHFPLNRSEVDAIFYHTIAMSGAPKLAAIYHGAVEKFGSWTDKPQMGEYSKIV